METSACWRQSLWLIILSQRCDTKSKNLNQICLSNMDVSKYTVKGLCQWVFDAIQTVKVVFMSLPCSIQHQLFTASHQNKTLCFQTAVFVSFFKHCNASFLFHWRLTLMQWTTSRCSSRCFKSVSSNWIILVHNLYILQVCCCFSIP